MTTDHDQIPGIITEYLPLNNSRNLIISHRHLSPDLYETIIETHNGYE